MDKKKVKKLVDELLSLIECTSGEYEDREILEEMEEKLKEVKEELSKSDWISVEDGLPEYMEKVFVTNKEHRDFVWKSHRENGDIPKRLDDNGFPAYSNITTLIILSLIGNLLESWRSKYGRKNR